MASSVRQQRFYRTRWRLEPSILILVLLVQSVRSLNLPPFFTRDMNQHTLTENTLPGTVVYTLEGRDPEGSPVKFAIQVKIFCILETGTEEIAVVQSN
jgi:hypothetical protein